MNAAILPDTGREGDLPEVLWKDANREFCRLSRNDNKGHSHAFIPVVVGSDHPTLESVNRLAHEYELRDYLDCEWAVRPLQFVRDRGRAMLLVEYMGGEPLDRLTGTPMGIDSFLRVAVSLASALSRLHARGVIHKDIKPANIIVDSATGHVWLTGFGIASRLLRDRQAPESPEFIAGTFAYMAPEQTGRVNRSIDFRSDLYSLGVTLYEMLIGGLPFTAADPMEWVHCHIARQPISPSARLASVPPVVSDIIMKLLSKTAEGRYQTAAGVESDLRRCLRDLETLGRVCDFALGDHDTPDRLMIPERLYGRDREVDTLLSAFDRIVAGGRPELVLVSGYSGIGKSAVVNELHKALVPPRGLYASGKFDQYKRDIPYATLAQAFQRLIRPLLSKSDDDLRTWRDALREALYPNGLLVVELVPDLKHIIGEQPPVPDLSPQEAQHRFQLVIERFIGVFARPEHPLALFLDDLQWLDTATLDLLHDLLSRTDLKNLLLIGAYRDNEVGATHPLMRTLDAISHNGTPVHNIVLSPLSCDDVGALLADSLHSNIGYVSPLATLIHDKTSGNPFFTIQFVATLAEEGVLHFDSGEGRWSWDLGRIHAKGYTDNVVELMVGKLSRLPLGTQRALQRFACMGNSAEFDVLQMASQVPIEQLHDQMWDAARNGLIFRSEDSYRFLHDRVQEAAYTLIPKDLRAEAHLRIGMLLAEHTAAGRRDEAIFEIVNQLNRGAHLITSADERERVADLNLIAGRRAKSSTAYDSALKYLRAGSALLTEETWERNYRLVFSIEHLLAECVLLTADMQDAEIRVSRLAERARGRHDYCVATRLRILLYTNWAKGDQAIDVFLEWLSRDGTVWSKRPTKEEAMREYARTWMLLGSRDIEELVNEPLITDPEVLDTLNVFSEGAQAAFFFDEHLSSLVICRMVSLSLEYGNCDASCFGYVWMAFLAGPRFDNYRDGFRFGQLGLDLVEKRGLTRYAARTYLCVGALVIPWTTHPESGRELVRRAFDAAYRVGDLHYVGYGFHVSITMSLTVGTPLAEVQAEAETAVAFSTKAELSRVSATCGAQLGLARTLRGLTTSFGRLDHDGYSERETESLFASDPNLGLPEFHYWVRKLQARFLSGDHLSAVDAALNARRLLWRAAANFEAADFQFYGALAHAAACEAASGDDKQQNFEALVANHNQIEVWAAHNPVTFENRAAIVGAEIARIEGRALEAQDLYEKAVRSARTHGFVHNEAIANELAGRFYAARGFENIATTYLRDARNCYLRWGADGKVRQLEQFYPHLSADKMHSELNATIQTSVERLDLATVIKVSEALSGEIVLEKLIDTLMRTAIEHAGAERGLLVLPRGDDFLIEAEATTGSSEVNVTLRQTSVTAAELPESVLRYVLRTKESVLLHDASAHEAFANDDYILEHHARSVLCMPILKQTRLLGILYLENNLTSHTFTPTRMAVLKLLASEAAISMENARLYLDLAEREAKIRRLVDANIIGIALWDFDGRILDANDAYLQMVGYEREDLLSGRLRWTDLTPPEWLEREERHLLPQLKVTGSLAPFEKEYFRKDGSRVPVLLGLATFKEDGDQGVAFALDLTERKRATDALRALQMDLAHANRLATMGQLTASISHEVNQPIGATRNNAHAALRFLAEDPPDLAEVREAIECAVKETYRAGDILGGIRDQVKKVPPRMEGVDVNEAIEEVMALVRGELLKHQVSLQMRLADRLSPVHADRVQLQQVMLNLILNAIEAIISVADEARELVISTDPTPAGEVLVAVRDSGPGVAPENRERVFESFFTTKPSGVGIGLSICRSIIEAHSGRLWVDAHEPRGAAFRFILPAHH